MTYYFNQWERSVLYKGSRDYKRRYSLNKQLKVSEIIGDLKKTNGWKKSALFMKEWWSGAHSVFENGSERVSALIFSLMSESWAKLKKLMSVEHVGHSLFNSFYFKKQML